MSGRYTVVLVEVSTAEEGIRPDVTCEVHYGSERITESLTSALSGFTRRAAPSESGVQVKVSKVNDFHLDCRILYWILSKRDHAEPAGWSGSRDLNPGPLRPERSALPDCATPRQTSDPVMGPLDDSSIEPAQTGSVSRAVLSRATQSGRYAF